MDLKKYITYTFSKRNASVVSLHNPEKSSPSSTSSKVATSSSMTAGKPSKDKLVAKDKMVETFKDKKALIKKPSPIVETLSLAKVKPAEKILTNSSNAPVVKPGMLASESFGNDSSLVRITYSLICSS